MKETRYYKLRLLNRTTQDKERANEVWWERFAKLTKTGSTGSEVANSWNRHAAYVNLIHKLKPLKDYVCYVTKARRGFDDHPGYEEKSMTTPVDYYEHASPVLTKQKPISKYWVKGGEYKDTSFTELLDEVTRGPFNTYEEAYDVWKGLSWSNVDDCHFKLTINSYDNI